MIAQRRTRRGIRWTAFWADLTRKRSLWATWEWGSYVGRSWSVSMLLSGLNEARKYSDEDDDDDDDEEYVECFRMSPTSFSIQFFVFSRSYIYIPLWFSHSLL